MAIKRWRHKHGPEGRKKHTDELSARLAPLEELQPEKALPQPTQSSNGDYHDATIRVDSTSVKTTSQLLDEAAERKGASIFYLEPVVIAILLCMLAFIAFIGWQITLMPEK